MESNHPISLLREAANREATAAALNRLGYSILDDGDSIRATWLAADSPEEIIFQVIGLDIDLPAIVTPEDVPVRETGETEETWNRDLVRGDAWVVDGKQYVRYAARNGGA